VKKARLFVYIFVFLLINYSFSVAKDKLDISMKAYLVTFEKKEGKLEVVKKPLPKTVKPGDIIDYEITVKNPTKKVFKNVFIKSLIPEGTVFVENSQTEGAVFSIDKGKSYHKPPVKYTVKKDGKVEVKVATPDMYTNVGWTIKEMKPGETKKFFFWVKVKK